ncbi:MAG TPA: hypothetical protein VF322_15960 [Gammaproteobacteria bacterium]
MAWPWLAVIAKNIPWVEIARRAPDIVAKSRALLEESRRQSAAPAAGGSLDDLSRRVAVLEQRDAQHARLLAEMVEQLQGLTAAVEVLTARNRVLTVAVAVLLIALFASVMWARVWLGS